MASTNFTTHYSIPLPLGTDLTTPMDYNEAAEAVDTALFGAVTDAGNASEAASTAVNTANTASAAVDAIGADLALEKAKIVQLQTRMTAAENNIDDVYTDVTDMITAYKEPSATSTHAYAIGDYFIYNETLYKATAAIAIGATIVPNTNCETTNVSSELKQINSDLAKSPVDVTNLFSITNPSVWWSAIYNPIARTVKLSCYGRGSFPNGSIVFTAPTDYAFNMAEGAIVGSLGSARDTNNNFAFTIALFSSTNNTHRIVVDYSENITAEEISFSIEYRIN